MQVKYIRPKEILESVEKSPNQNIFISWVNLSESYMWGILHNDDWVQLGDKQQRNCRTVNMDMGVLRCQGPRPFTAISYRVVVLKLFNLKDWIVLRIVEDTKECLFTWFLYLLVFLKHLFISSLKRTVINPFHIHINSIFFERTTFKKNFSEE